MKRKIGDKVRVRRDLVAGTKYGEGFLLIPMTKFLGNEDKIESISSDGKVFALETNPYWWTDEMLEDVDQTKYTVKDIEDSFDTAISQLKKFVIALEECAEKIKTFESCQK